MYSMKGKKKEYQEEEGLSQDLGKRPRVEIEGVAHDSKHDALEKGALLEVSRRGKEFDRMIDRLEVHAPSSTNTGKLNRFPEGPFTTGCLRRSTKMKKFEILKDNGHVAYVKSHSMYLAQRTTELLFMLKKIGVPQSWIGIASSLDDAPSSQGTSSSSDDALKHNVNVFDGKVYPMLGPRGLGKSLLAFEIMIRIKKNKLNVKFIYVDKGKSSLMQMSMRMICFCLAEETVRCFPELLEECLRVFSANNEESCMRELLALFSKVGAVCEQDGLYVMLIINNYDQFCVEMEPLRKKISETWKYYHKCTHIILVGCVSHHCPYLGIGLMKPLVCNTAFVSKCIQHFTGSLLSAHDLEHVVSVTGGFLYEVARLVAEMQGVNLNDAIQRFEEKRKAEICNEQQCFWDVLSTNDANRFMKSILIMQYGLSAKVFSCGFMDTRYMSKLDDDTIAPSISVAKDAIVSVAYEKVGRKCFELLSGIADHMFRHPVMFTNGVIGKVVELLIHEHVMQGGHLLLDDVFSIKRGKPSKMKESWDFYGLTSIDFKGNVPPSVNQWDSSLKKRLFFNPLSSNYPYVDCVFYCDLAQATPGFPIGVTAVQTTITSPLMSHSNTFFKVGGRDNDVHAVKWKDLFQCEENNVRLLFLAKEVPKLVSAEWLAHDKPWMSTPNYHVTTFRALAKANPDLRVLNLLYA